MTFCFWSYKHLDNQLLGSGKWNVPAGNTARSKVTKTRGW